MNQENVMREVHCEDALVWLNHYIEKVPSSFLGSLPDISEFPGFTLNQWKDWFESTAELILSKTSQDGVTLFFQSDIKHEGIWIDKAYLIQKVAEKLGHQLLFHKIYCRAPAGTITFGRPAYSHMICFSKSVIPDLSKSTPDVIPDLGDKTWVRGMGLEASIHAAQFVLKQTKTRNLINPFCGEGSVLAAANFCGLSAIGIERSPKRAEKAKHLKVSADGSCWILN